MAALAESTAGWTESASPDTLSSWFSGRFPGIEMQYPLRKLMTHLLQVTDMAGIYDRMDPLQQMSVRISLSEKMRGSTRPDALYDAVLLGTLIKSPEAADACMDLIDADKLPGRGEPVDVKIWGIGLAASFIHEERVFDRMKGWFDDDHFDERYKGQIAVALAHERSEVLEELIVPLIVLADRDDETVHAESVFPAIRNYVGPKAYN